MVGKDEGFFRIIVVAGGVEHVWHRLYIQWLRSDARTQGYELIRTVNVQELNLGQGYLLGVKTSFGNFNSFKIDVTAIIDGRTDASLTLSYIKRLRLPASWQAQRDLLRIQ